MIVDEGPPTGGRPDQLRSGGPARFAYRRRRAVAGTAAILGLAVAMLVAAPVAANDRSPATGAFHLVAARRLLDTRSSPLGKLAAGGSIDVHVPEAARAVALVVSVTVTEPEQPGFVTLYATGSPRPTVSTLNYEAGWIISNQATVQPDGNGNFTIYTMATTHVVIDLVGVYDTAASAAEGRFVPVVAHRVVDTRQSGPPVQAGTSTVVVPGSSSAEAAVVTLTVTQTSGPGFVTTYRSDAALPGTSTLNFEAADTTRAVLATVPLAPDGTFRVYASVRTHVVVDVVGYFTDSSAPLAQAGLYLPVAPTRQFDTRNDQALRLAAGSAVGLRYGQEPWAVLGNLTITDGRNSGFATAAPATSSSLSTSSVNTSQAGESIAAAVAVAYAPGAGVQFTTSQPGHLIFDLNGVYLTDTGGFASPTPSSVQVGTREAVAHTAVAPFGSLTFDDLLAQYPDATSTRAAVMTSDGTVYSFGQQSVALPTASTIKSLVLGCTLARFQDGGLTQLDGRTAGLAQQMISVSDNNATTTLISDMGGTSALQRCGYRFGAASIVLNTNGWGVTQIPPESFVSILRNLLRSDSTVLDAHWVFQARAYMLSSNIIPGERWGVGAGLPGGAAFWVKNGWWSTSPGDFRYPGTRINSVGMVEQGNTWWIIAIQGDRYNSQVSGIRATEFIAATINRNMTQS